MKRRLAIAGIVAIAVVVAVVIWLNRSTDSVPTAGDESPAVIAEYRGINALVESDNVCEVLVDFGVVNSRNIATKNIRVTNQTDAPIVLVDYETTCRCTWLDMPREAIEPGDYADLTLSFDPRGEWGVIGNYINILTSTPGSEVVMWISAEIGSI